MDPNVKSSPFRFLDLPFELRSQIIKLSIGSNRPKSKAQHGAFRTGFEIEPHDFTISATGLKCHSFTSFNLLSVCRQIRHESMTIIFQNASVCLQVEIPRYGGISKVAASVSGNLKALKAYPLLCDLARGVTITFRPESAYVSGPLIETEGNVVPLLREHPVVMVFIGLCVCIYAPVFALAKLASWIHRTSPFQRRHADLQALVDTLAHGFRSRKSLKIYLYLNDLYLQDLAIILRLFEAPSCSITLEERWIQWHYPVMPERVRENYETNYKSFIAAAAEEARHNLLLAVSPKLENFEVDETDVTDTRGSKIIGKRRRTWIEESI